MNDKLVAVVSLFNSGAWLKNRIENLLASDYHNLEVWCVNAASPDPLDDEIPKNYPVVYHRLDHDPGVYGVWNWAIERTDAEYVCNANADDLVAPGCYGKLVGALQGTELGVAYCSWHCTAVPNQAWPPAHADRGGRPGNFAGNFDVAQVGHFPVWRRRLHERLGPFDASLRALGDAEFWSRAWHLAGAKFIWVDQFLGCYLWRGDAAYQNLWTRAINDDEWARFHAAVAGHRR